MSAQPEPVLHRHADHDPSLICRPALGRGLCEMIGGVESETCVVPARYVLGVLHRQDPDAGPRKDDGGNPISGRTICGEDMYESELWQPIERRPGDRVCPECAEPGKARAGDEQEAGLW